MRLLNLLLPARSRARSAYGSDEEARSIDTVDPDEVDTQAILWHVRLRDGGEAVQASFAAWLQENPRNATAFASIRSEDSQVDYIANDAGRSRNGLLLRYGRWGAGGAAAIPILAFLTIGTLRTADPYEVKTRPGEQRIVSLAPGTQVTMNGGTRVRLDRRDPRVATLLSGEAIFDVRHDAEKPFRLSVLGRTIEDVGTVFNVAADRGAVRVAVAEGSVLYNPDGEKVSLRAGQGLIDADERRAIQIIDTPPDTVGGWRRGQFVYAGQPLARVAADLSRALGVTIVASPTIATRPFTGAIALHDGGPNRTAAELSRITPALDVRLERTSDGWMLKPGSGAAR